MICTLPLAGCLVPDAPFRSAASLPKTVVTAPAASPAQAYAVDPISGGRLAIDPTSAPPHSASLTFALSADAEVEAFAAGHPLFELVRSDMARLIRGGRASSLQSAYDQAVAARASRFRAELATPARP